MRNQLVNRRRFLIAGVGSAVAVGTIGGLSAAGYARGRAAWVERVVRRNLPGVVLDETTLSTFVRDVLAGDLLSPHKRRAAVFAQQSVPWLAQRVPQIRNGLEKIERQVLTEYLLGSNFFRVSNPKGVTITYYGPAIACANPFAVLT